jgi:hypothetical protein
MRRPYMVGAAVCAAALIANIGLLAACDRGARKDLPQEQQNLDESEAIIVLNPDKFPNLAHKCLDTTGIWTTTDRAVWIIYRDPRCGGEGEPFVIDNIPGVSGDWIGAP